ncbi:MAG: acyltransferase family protein [Acetatifactor sp.]
MIKRRLSWADSLKGIAICMIVMIHANGAAVESAWRHFAQSGWSGVQIFFILSAFFTMTELKKQEVQDKDFLVGKWLVRRMMKLVPMYYFALLVGILFYRGQNVWLGSSMKLTFTNLLFHLLFLHTLIPYYSNSILWVEWYLGDFFLFSVFTCMIYKRVKSLKKSLLLVGISIPISLVVTNALCMVSPLPKADAYVWNGYVGTYSPIKQFPAWTLGFLLFFLMQNEKLCAIMEKSKKLRIALLIGVLLAIATLIGIHSDNTILFAFSYMILAYIISYFNIPIFDNVVWQYIGQKSYGIYLYHFFIILLIEKIHVFKNTTNFFLWLVKYVLVLILALLFTAMWERISKKIKQTVCCRRTER